MVCVHVHEKEVDSPDGEVASFTHVDVLLQLTPAQAENFVTAVNRSLDDFYHNGGVVQEVPNEQSKKLE
jgi:hypothetical protein